MESPNNPKSFYQLRYINKIVQSEFGASLFGISNLWCKHGFHSLYGEVAKLFSILYGNSKAPILFPQVRSKTAVSITHSELLSIFKKPMLELFEEFPKTKKYTELIRTTSLFLQDVIQNVWMDSADIALNSPSIICPQILTINIEVSSTKYRICKAW